VSTDTSVAVLVVSAALAAWIFNLVRAGHLYVGYGVIFGAAIVTAATVAGLPLLGTTDILQSHAEAFIVGASAFVVVILVYTLSQLTRWSNRLTALTQELAIRGANASLDQDQAPRQPPS
jgi:hypothetical protein